MYKCDRNKERILRPVRTKSEFVRTHDIVVLYIIFKCLSSSGAPLYHLLIIIICSNVPIYIILLFRHAQYTRIYITEYGGTSINPVGRGRKKNSSCRKNCVYLYWNAGSKMLIRLIVVRVIEVSLQLYIYINWYTCIYCACLDNY